jgi:hypothetical protein
MVTANSEVNLAASVIAACVEHGRRMLNSQLPLVCERNYDFTPIFVTMATQLYLVGVMWRFGEQFDLPTNPRDRGFICLMSMLIDEGLSSKNAQRRVAYLNEISRDAKGRDTVAIAAGYRSVEGDGALASVFDHFRNAPEVSGARYRFLERTKPIAAILAGAAIVISLLVGVSWGVALSVGTVVGVSVLGIGLAIYRQMVRRGSH